MNIEIELEKSDGSPICFTHAVKAIMNGEEGITITGADTSDCGMSGYMKAFCRVCSTETDEHYCYSCGFCELDSGRNLDGECLNEDSPNHGDSMPEGMGCDKWEQG